MKNGQKRKITQNYHLLTKLESGKCCRVTATIHVISLNCGGIYTNAQIGKQLFHGQKALSVNNVMLLFLKRWWLKKKKFLNRRTVLASAWSECCGVTSQRCWPAVYWKISDPMFFFFGRESFMSMSNVCLQGKKREMLEYCRSREWGTSWSRKLSSSRPRITGFFFVVSQRTSIWRYKM